MILEEMEIEENILRNVTEMKLEGWLKSKKDKNGKKKRKALQALRSHRVKSLAHVRA